MSKDNNKDIAYAVAKAGLGSIPIIGAAASELLQLIVTPPIEKRRKEWMIQIGEKLKELEEKEGIDLERLRDNDVFVDVVIQATQEAIKTSEKEKVEYFKNAILNTASGEHPELSEIQMFLKLVSDFTIWHIKILKLFDNPTEWFSSNELTAPSFTAAGLSSILEIAYPELKGRREFYDLIWSELKRAGLHRTSGLHSTMTGSGLMISRTTDFGKKFLAFISSN
jgi:hypothetical protein